MCASLTDRSLFGGKGGFMDCRGFYRRVVDHPELEWLGSVEGRTPEKDAVLVRCAPTGYAFSVTIPAIADNDWQVLEDVLFSRRSARIMTHVTRIVGYYSQIQNWNHSKVAELRDRHKGNYGVPDESQQLPIAAD